MIEKLKARNRTLVEMITGMLLFGIVCQIPGFFFLSCLLPYALGLWLGVAMAVLASLHMFYTLDRGLDLPPAAAQKKIFFGYLTRYVVFALALTICAFTGYLHPLIVFLGYMSLKVSAFLQPFTHKYYNKLFHEVDPIPLSLEELEKLEQAKVAEEEASKN